VNATPELQETRDTSAPPKAIAAAQSGSHAPKISLGTLLGLPAAVAGSLIVHLLISKAEMPDETRDYTIFLSGALGVSLVLVAAQAFWMGLRHWLKESGPILIAVALLLCVGEVATTGFRWLPMPYFPSPAGILQSMIHDRVMIFDSTWHSLLLLAGGYSLGVVAGVVSGVLIGWFAPWRYWGTPILKWVGPVPATAWIPLALVVSPSAILSAVGLIAFAVWFPVTMLTASGISNTRASYLDVARTLGAKPSYLVFRVAIPAAMPNIFIGLFMGLGSSFLTLVVAETVGVKSGLGWYVSWAQGWAEYGKVYGALVIMSAFFSTIMTVLFKVRDRVLVWQKGTIKW